MFLARSGGGKSTLASLCDRVGIPVLGDDAVLVLEKGSAFYTRPLPRQSGAQPARLALDEGCCLRQVFFLEKAAYPSVGRLSPLQAVRRCLGEHCLQGFGRMSVHDRLHVLDRLIRLFRAVPAYVLHFRKDNSFWKVIDELEEKERTERSGV